MRADLENKQADTACHVGLWRYELWKVFATAIAAAATVFGTIGGVLGYLPGRIY